MATCDEHLSNVFGRLAQTRLAVSIGFMFFVPDDCRLLDASGPFAELTMSESTERKSGDVSAKVSEEEVGVDVLLTLDPGC